MPTYRNTKTGQVVVTARERPVFGRSLRWEVIDDDGQDGGYGGRTVDELRAVADSRGLEVEGSGADGRVLKADLVAALEADDGR